MKKIIVLLGCLTFLFVLGCSSKENSDISKIDLSKIDKLMIVAHPDDETIWGGGNLAEEDYLVVCVTCGDDKARVEEFKAAMKTSNDSYLMLYFDDFNQPEQVKKQDEKITKALSKIIEAKAWDKIVTHNKYGEYGHPQHEEISILTTKAVRKIVGNTDNLWYFEPYILAEFMSEELHSQLRKISNSALDKKLEMIDVYKTQSFITPVYGHVFSHENWVPANEWKD